MNRQISGIHHVTAIAGDPQRNIDFYADALGLRLVKLTVNFDDPFTHHLYYGDGRGSPGTILTFFPWPAAGRGSPGTGQVSATAFAVPEGTLKYWTERLADLKIDVAGPSERFGEQFVSISDPDGMKVELVATARGALDKSWKDGPVPSHSAIRGLHHVTLCEEGYERTATLLTVTLGFELLGREGNRFRYAVGDQAPGDIRRRGMRTGSAHRPGRGRERASRCLAHSRRSAARSVAPGNRETGLQCLASHGPKLLPFDLLPRAGRDPVRDRNRFAGFYS